MRFGLRTPSLRGRISARLSLRRMVRSKIRAPKGFGLITNPKKALYNRVYNRTTFSIDKLAKGSGCLTLIFLNITIVIFSFYLRLMHIV